MKKKKSPAEDSEQIVAARRAGASAVELSAEFGWSQSAINKVLANAGEVDHQEYDPSPVELEKWCRRHLRDLERWHGAEGAQL